MSKTVCTFFILAWCTFGVLDLSHGSPVWADASLQNPTEELSSEPVESNPARIQTKGRQPELWESRLVMQSVLAVLVLGSVLFLTLVSNYQRRRAEIAMRLSEERLQALFNNKAVGIGITDTRGNYIQMNDTWRQMINLPPQSIEGHSIDDETPAGERMLRREVFHRLTSGDSETYRHERAFTRQNNSIFWGDHTVTPIHDGRGNITSTIHLTVDVSERRKAEEEIRKLAYYDNLTALPNRTLFSDRLTQALRMARREDYLLALLFLDLDRFKVVNDTLGHSVGDLLLKQVAERLLSCVRAADTVGRLGGDEFVILLPHVLSREDVERIAQNILHDLRAAFNLADQEVFCSTSIGAAIFPYDGCDETHLLKHADMAMYEAKAKGRNTCAFFSEEMQRTSTERVQLESDLRRALHRNEFFLEYQPQYDMKSCRITGLEALLRWQHPQRGVVLPTEFIPLAESTGLIRPIGEWVLKNACAQGRAWYQQGLLGIRIGVNLSANQLNQPDLVDIIEDILKETGFSADNLELELTESTFMENARDTIDTLTDLKVRGIKLAIDDFGTGYSSLNYLKNFPIDRIKIDRSFIRDILTDPNDAVIVETIIAMAHNLGLDVIAEGVESLQQARFLLQHRCSEAQGAWLCRPISPDNLVQDSFGARVKSVDMDLLRAQLSAEGDQP